MANSSKNPELPKMSTNSSNPQPKESNGDNNGLESSKVGPHPLVVKNRQIFQLRSNSVDVDVHLFTKRSADQDVTFVVVPCHKIFLRTCPYFEKLLDSIPQSDYDGEILKIDIDLDPETLEEMLRYIYTGEMEINDKNLIQLFEASHKLQLNDELMIKFTKFQIGPLINENNWLELLRIFNSAGGGDICGKFLKEIFGFLREKSSEFMNWPLFVQLTFDEIRLILHAESHVYKNAKDFQASLLKWMAHDPYSKSQLIDELSAFNYVELPAGIIGKSEVEPKVEEKSQANDNGVESAVNSDDDKEKNISQNFDSDGQPLAKRVRFNLPPCPEPPSFSCSILFCADNHFYNYSFQEKKITKLCQLPMIDLDGFSMVLANRRLFIMCGQDRNTPSFDMSSKVYSCPLTELQKNKQVSWKDEPVLLDMANFSTICVNNDIYTIGGIYNLKEKDIFEKPIFFSLRLKLSSGRENKKTGWNIAFTFNGRSQCAVVLLNGMLYIIGGIGINPNIPENDNLWGQGPERFKPGFDDIPFESVEVFNIKHKKVESLANLHLARFDHQAVTFQKKIFVLGGKVLSNLEGNLNIGFKYKYTDSVEVYDPETKIWTDGPSLTAPRANFAAFVMDEKIFVLGGNEGKPTMEVYDSRKNEWNLEPCGDFPVKTNFSQFVIIK